MPSVPSKLTLVMRGLFVLYTGVLLTATHWPGLAIKGPIDRTDLVIHVCAFGLWTLLLGSTRCLARIASPKRRTLVLILIAIAYGWFDELTQPMFDRVFDLTDAAADMTGAILAGIVWFVLWNRSSRAKANHDESMIHPSADTRS